MVLVVVLVVTAAVEAQEAPPAGKGVIRGVVTGADTGRLLRGADIRIAGSNALAEPRWARTDEQGRYEVTDLAARRYTLTASKVGYLALGYGQHRPGEAARPVDVSDTMPLDKINFGLPRAGVIVARVTDSFGDPVRGVVVRALMSGFVNGQRQLQQGAWSSMNAR
jgi:hypothetical protein